MAKEAYHSANSEFVDDNFEGALKLYDQAIAKEGNNAEFFVKRAICNIRLKNFTEALSDANNAIKVDPNNAKAYYRKGIALFNLDEFESSKSSFDQAKKRGITDPNLQTWIRKCDAEISNEEEDEAQSTPAKTTSQPQQSSSSTSSSSTSNASDLPPPLESPSENKENKTSSTDGHNTSTTASTPTNSNNNTTTASTSSTTTTSSAAADPTIIQKPDLTGLPVGNFQIPKAEKVRSSWYQTETHVVVEFFVKNLTESDVEVEFNDESVELSIRLRESDSDWVYDKVLGGKIVPKECTKTIGANKLELKLKKEKPGSWKVLEKGGDPTDVNPEDVKKLYPSSKGAKNWDKLAADIPDEKVEGEQALNKVFQQIYQGGSDEQRRAMIKSFTESGGTVLSTNWEDVGKKKVKGSPPKGMEMKEWEAMNRGK